MERLVGTHECILLKIHDDIKRIISESPPLEFPGCKPYLVRDSQSYEPAMRRPSLSMVAIRKRSTISKGPIIVNGSVDDLSPFVPSYLSRLMLRFMTPKEQESSLVKIQELEAVTETEPTKDSMWYSSWARRLKGDTSFDMNEKSYMVATVPSKMMIGGNREFYGIQVNKGENFLKSIRPDWLEDPIDKLGTHGTSELIYRLMETFGMEQKVFFPESLDLTFGGESKIEDDVYLLELVNAGHRRTNNKSRFYKGPVYEYEIENILGLCLDRRSDNTNMKDLYDEFSQNLELRTFIGYAIDAHCLSHTNTNRHLRQVQMDWIQNDTRILGFEGTTVITSTELSDIDGIPLRFVRKFPRMAVFSETSVENSYCRFIDTPCEAYNISPNVNVIFTMGEFFLHHGAISLEHSEDSEDSEDDDCFPSLDVERMLIDSIVYQHAKFGGMSLNEYIKAGEFVFKYIFKMSCSWYYRTDFTRFRTSIRNIGTPEGIQLNKVIENL